MIAFLPIIVGMALTAVASASIALNALRAKKISAEHFVRNYWGYIELHVLGAIYALFSRYDRRFSIVFIGWIVALIFVVSAPYLLGYSPAEENVRAAVRDVWWWLCIVEFFIVAYYTTRLSVAAPIFLSKKIEKTSDALDGSWHMTKGQTKDIFICQMIIILFMLLLVLVWWSFVSLAFPSRYMDIFSTRWIAMYFVFPLCFFFWNYMCVGVYDELVKYKKPINT